MIELEQPIVLAPMAGGPSTPELAAAVSEAGGLGVLAAGYLSPEDVRARLGAARRLTSRPLGVNLFADPGPAADPAAVARYRERIAPEAAAHGVEPGVARHDDDALEAKLDVVRELAPEVVTFAFGCPPAGVVAGLRERGCDVWVTVTEPDEAREAAAAGATALVAQGVEAGGHRGSSGDEDDRGTTGLLALLALVRAAVPDVPLVAAGGIADGRGVAAVLAAGASAAQLGTAFLLTPEAGTAPAVRAAVASDAPTRLTRAFSGRRARGIVNRFLREHDAGAPAAYPEVHHLTAPLRATGRDAGDADVVNLWAGQAHALARDLPAGELVVQLAAEARAALTDAGRRL